ncbi:MAG: chalcone isomerase family protein [Casimicrobiaceae bacterium]
MKRLSRPSRPSRWTVLLALPLLATTASAATLSGVKLPDTLRLGERTLRLASCGVRDTFWIDHYAAGLYLPAGAPPRATKDPKQPKAVQMKVIEARYLPEDIPQKWRAALATELRSEPMMRVRRSYSGLSSGDTVVFSYLPDRGVTMRVNGRTIVKVGGHDVIDAILRAWAGKDTISGKLHRLASQHPC